MDNVQYLIEKYYGMMNGELTISGALITDIIEEFGTPIYIYDSEVMKKKLQYLQTALPEFEIDKIDITGDYANVRTQITLSQFFFYFVQKADIAGGIFMFGNNKNIVIASFMYNQPTSTLLMRAVFPVAACIAAEQDNHLYVFAKCTDFHGDKFHFILL